MEVSQWLQFVQNVKSFFPHFELTPTGLIGDSSAFEKKKLDSNEKVTRREPGSEEHEEKQQKKRKDRVSGLDVSSLSGLYCFSREPGGSNLDFGPALRVGL